MSDILTFFCHNIPHFIRHKIKYYRCKAVFATTSEREAEITKTTKMNQIVFPTTTTFTIILFTFFSGHSQTNSEQEPERD